MSMELVYGRPGHLIRRAHQITTALFAEECGEYQLTTVQYAAMVSIRENADLDASKLSTLIVFDRSTLGDVLDRLERREFIERSPSAADRRVKNLKLTDLGRSVLDAVEPFVSRVQTRLLSPLEPKEKILLVQLLAKLVSSHAIEEIGQGNGDGPQAVPVQ